MRLSLVTPPGLEPLSPADARSRIPALTSDTTDGTIHSWVKAERQRLDGADGMLRRALNTQTWDLILDGFPCGGYDRGGDGYGPTFGDWDRSDWQYHPAEIALPLPPLQAVVSISYLDYDGNDQVVDPATYRLIGNDPGYVVLKPTMGWPGTTTDLGSVTVRFTCGYGGAADDVPEPIRMALALGVTLSQSLAGRDLFLRSDQVQDVGTFTYSGGGDGASTLSGQMDRLLMPYRVGSGIS